MLISRHTSVTNNLSDGLRSIIMASVGRAFPFLLRLSVRLIEVEHSGCYVLYLASAHGVDARGRTSGVFGRSQYSLSGHDLA